MDIKREPSKKRGKYVYGAIAVAAIAATTLALRNLEPAAPPVERATLWIDTVHKGRMVRQVRGPGTLVPEQIRWIAATTAGRVEQLPVRAGETVHGSTLIMELSNPDVQLQALAAQQQLAGAEAQLNDLRTNLETQRLNQEAAVGAANTQLLNARRTVTEQEALTARGLGAANLLAQAKDQATELEQRYTIEKQRLKLLEDNMPRQLALQQQQVARMRAIADFQQNRVSSMQVHSGTDGQLTEMVWELGQWVNAGATIAKVAQPGRLKAVLRIPETQAKDVTIGQPASIDTHNGLIAGHVMRIDPSAIAGTVTVEVALDGELPKGARPDLSVDGTVEIERLEDVLYVGRPAYGQAESTVGLFKLEADGKSAVRTQVKLGRSSVNTIEVISGLIPGDKVIISDMSQYDNFERVRIK